MVQRFRFLKNSVLNEIVRREVFFGTPSMHSQKIYFSTCTIFLQYSVALFGVGATNILCADNVFLYV